MIVGHDLQQWLADRERQRGALEAALQFAVSWRRGSVHQRFQQAIDTLGEPTMEAVAEAVRGLFEDHAWTEHLLDDLAAEMARDPFFEPPFALLRSEIHSGFLVYEDDRVSIALGVIQAARLAAKKDSKRGATSINFTGHGSVLKLIRAGGAFMSFWEAPAIGAGFVADAASRCFRTGGRRLANGEVLTIDGRSQSYVIEHASRDMMMLHASIKTGRAPLAVEYDSNSHQLIGTSATDDGASRIQLLATLLRKMDAADAVPVLVELLDDPDFFVRWHVMKELLGLDAIAAMPHLRRLAEQDPHPDVRRAAASVVARAARHDPRLARAA